MPNHHRELPEVPRVNATLPGSACEAEHHGSGGYFLTPYVFPCFTRHGIILLHLPRNRYYGLSKPDMNCLEKIVANWPTQDGVAGATSTSVISENCSMTRLVQSLVEVGVLQQTRPSRCDFNALQISLEGALASIGDEIIGRASVGPAHVATFSFSLMSAAGCLRCMSLKSTVGFVSRRKARAIANGYRFSLDHTAELVFIFRSLRPYFFVAEGRCLLHALTLVTFLAIHGEFPCWVLGVRTEPWAAHSWVQHDDYLLDTNPEKVCEYQPILAV